ncbi:MAG: hypothetical protein NT062_09900, partial [Proteobacteria bacterium]|nr:hypothetical protein [Pseudomonadota bacterium]
MQLLYQRRFYTANLLLGPRWMLIIPALIAGFYGLYLAKVARPALARVALAASLGAFVFVAYAWSELHQLGLADAGWRAFYGAGQRVYFEGALPVRVAMWLAGAVVMFATVASWSAPELIARVRLAKLALVGLALAATCASVLGAWATHAVVAHGWLYILIAATVVAAVGFARVVVRPAGRGLVVATGAVSAALLAAAVVREAPRLALIEPPRVESGGFPIFALTLVIGCAAIAWIVRTVRS